MNLPGNLGRGTRAAVISFWAILLIGLVVYGVHIGFGVGTSAHASNLLDGWLYSSLVLLGALGVLARAVLVRAERLAWASIGVGVLCWSAGDIYWWRVLSLLDEPPFPSIADGLYLAFYPLVYAGIVLLVRARVRRFHASQWLDGLAASLVIAAAGAALLLPPIIASSEGSVAVVATNLAYPLGDLLILASLGALAGVMRWRPGRAIGTLGLGCLAFTAADALYLHQVAADTYVEGHLLDLFWPLGTVIIGLAAWQPTGLVRQGRIEGWAVLMLPGLVATAALALLVYERHSLASEYASWLAAGALAVCLVRAGLTCQCQNTFPHQ